MPTIVRTTDEIDRVLDWAAEGIDGGTRYADMSYEQGVQDMYDWLFGFTDHAPDED